MSNQNKYKTETATGIGSDGERKHRDHTKTGKLQRRRDNRRLEAIARQVHRIKLVEATLKGTKAYKEIVEYVESFNDPSLALDHANISLIKLRGGIPHSKLTVRKETATVSPTVTPEATPAPVTEEKPKNKYRKRKSAKLAEADTPQ